MAVNCLCYTLSCITSSSWPGPSFSSSRPFTLYSPGPAVTTPGTQVHMYNILYDIKSLKTAGIVFTL